MTNMPSTNETTDNKIMFFDFPLAGNISVQIISIHHTQYTEFPFRMAIGNELPHSRLFPLITYTVEIQTK